MRFVKNFFRFAAICLVAIPFVWFGVRYSQPVGPAYGEIFRELAEPLLLQQSHTLSGNANSNWRTVSINNNLVRFKLSNTQGSIRSIFDALESSLPWEQDLNILPGRLWGSGQGKQIDGRNSFDTIPVFRTEWKDWGALGIILRKPNEKAVSSSPATLSTTVVDQVSTIPALLAVLAFLGQDRESTTLFTFWFDDSFDFRKLLPAADADALGRDPREIPRYPGLKRQFSFDETGDGYESTLAVYHGPGNYHEIANFYRSRMDGLEWEIKETAGIAGARQKSETVLYFVQKGKECLIYTGSSSEPGLVRTIVSLRESRAKG